MISHDNVISLINHRRMLAELTAKEVKMALREFPNYLKLENEIGAMLIERGKLVAESMPLGDLDERIAAAEQSLAEMATAKGFCPTDREPKYNCKICSDRGFIGGEMCVCARKILIENLQENCGDLITGIDSISDIDTEIYGQGKARYKKMLSALEKYVDNFPRSTYRNLVFAGDTGTGKSYLASVICNGVMKSGHAALFVNAVKLNEVFLKRHISPFEEKEQILEPFVTCDLLVIDDLGAESMYNNVTKSSLYLLLTERADKNTIITTNFTDTNDLILRYDKKIASRITDTRTSAYILFEGKDLRHSQR